jgi:hypothetical protein
MLRHLAHLLQNPLVCECEQLKARPGTGFDLTGGDGNGLVHIRERRLRSWDIGVHYSEAETERI